MLLSTGGLSVWLALFCSVSYRCEEILRKVTKEEWFTLAHSARVETIVTMKCQWQECDVAGRVSSTVRKHAWLLSSLPPCVSYRFLARKQHLQPQWAGLLTSDNTKIRPHRHTQGPISEVILDSVKLTVLTAMGCVWRTEIRTQEFGSLRFPLT